MLTIYNSNNLQLVRKMFPNYLQKWLICVRKLKFAGLWQPKANQIKIQKNMLSTITQHNTQIFYSNRQSSQSPQSCQWSKEHLFITELYFIAWAISSEWLNHFSHSCWQNAQMGGLCYSGAWRLSDIIQLYHKPAISNNTHYSLLRVSTRSTVCVIEH